MESIRGILDRKIKNKKDQDGVTHFGSFFFLEKGVI